MPPDTIAIRYYDKTINSFSSYLTTTLHEYLHFYSSNPDENLDPFLEEGITDTFKVVISSKYLDKDQVYVSYIDNVQVINDLLDYLPKDKLIALYFDKDQTELEKWFSDRYSEEAYKTFMMDAKNLTYAPLTDRKTREKYVKNMITILDEKKTSTPSTKK